MAIEVRIPTILRTYTGGAKSVEGSGTTLDELLDDVDSRNQGLRERLVDDAGLRRFVNVYLNDEDVRFLVVQVHVDKTPQPGVVDQPFPQALMPRFQVTKELAERRT